MIKKILLVCFVCFSAIGVKAQTGYAFRISFADKVGSLTYADSLQFLSQKALDRRSAQGIALNPTDLPLVKAYVDSAMLKLNALKLHNRSKWFNQIVAITYDSARIIDVLNLPFVSSVKLVAIYANYSQKNSVISQLSARKFAEVTTNILNNSSQKTLGDTSYYSNSYRQITINNGDFLHDQGLKGEGMTIAVLDAGFRFANQHTQFDSLNNSGRLLSTYSFVRDTTDVYTTINDHGTNVAGLIAAQDSGSYIGSAINANMHLLVTEDELSEQPIEEDNWLSGAEYADSVGADIINGSLGYNEFDAPHASYTWQNDLTGNKTQIAQAANMAVSKGIFTCLAQGNSGMAVWHYMLTPADADSAYSVGSVDSFKQWSDSGYGPNADGQTKPNGMAMGKRVSLVGGNGLIGTANGSSFASPLIAGMVACLWQGCPTKTESEIRHLVMQVSDRFTSPTYIHGFGIPNFELAYNIATGIDEFELKHKTNFQVYPNPTNGSFSIRVKQTFLPYDFELYDAGGRKVGSLENINNFVYENQLLNNLPTGTYFIRLNSNGRIEQTKLIKQ